jgi:hypothetical protein
MELGQTLSPSELRITEFAPALEAEPPVKEEPAQLEKSTPSVMYGPAQWAHPSFTGGFPGSAFTPQSDGTLRCPADHPLYPQERRQERNGSLRVLYAARIRHCRSCPLRTQCQESAESIKPRRVSAVFWPLSPSCSDSFSMPPEAPTSLPLAPVLWKDWPRCSIRREWLKVIRGQTVGLTERLATLPRSPVALSSEDILTRAQRAHWRLSWAQRLARNARPSDAFSLTVTLHGLPATFAHSFGFDLLATA